MPVSVWAAFGETSSLAHGIGPWWLGLAVAIAVMLRLHDGVAIGW